MLRSSELLRAIPAHELEVLANRVHPRFYAANEFVFRKGDQGASVMFVASGRVKIVSVGRSGAEVILNVMQPGQVFGEISLLDGKPRSADAIAATEAELLVLARRDFLEVLSRNFDVAVQMMAILCERLRLASNFVEDAVLLDSRTRLLHRLKLMAEQYGSVEPDGIGVRVAHGLSQQELGDAVGLTRVSINRVFRDWRERGLIQDGRGYIVVRDFSALESEVEGD